MTIEGTVREILGYPALFLIRDARSPAVNAPIKAVTAGGIAGQIYKFQSEAYLRLPRSVAAVAASRIGLLNMTEKPNTPQKLAIRCKYYPHSYWH